MAAVAPVSGVGSGEVRLTWSAPSSDGGSPVTDYVIEQSTDGVAWVTVVDGVSTATSYMVTGLSNGTAYQFRVSARNAVGDGAAERRCHGDPADGAVGAADDFGGGGSGVGVGSGEVRLTWSAPASDGGSPVTDYVIEQSTNGTVWVTVVDGVSTATTFTWCRVCRTGRRISSGSVPAMLLVTARRAPSSTATPRTVPSAPLALSAAVAPVSGVGSGEVRLTWSAPSSDGGSPVTDYVIEQSTNGTTWVTVVDGVSTATSRSR